MARQAPRARVTPHVGAALLLGALVLFGAGPSAWAAGDGPGADASALRWAERPLPGLGCRVVCPTSWRIDGRTAGGSTAEAGSANAADSTVPAGSKATAQPAPTDADTSADSDTRAEARADADRSMVVRLGPPDGSVRASVRRLAGRRDLKAVVERLGAAQRAAGWTAARPPIRGMLAGYDAAWFTVTVPAAGAKAPALTQRVCAIDTHRACFVLTYGAKTSRYHAASAVRFVESFTLAPAEADDEATDHASATDAGADASPDTRAPGQTQAAPAGPDPAPRYGCAKCDLDYPKSASYCARCGGPLGTVGRWGCPRCRLVAPREDRFCTRCGRKLKRW